MSNSKLVKEMVEKYGDIKKKVLAVARKSQNKKIQDLMAKMRKLLKEEPEKETGNLVLYILIFIHSTPAK